MLCRRPYILSSSVPVGCGHCIPCRVNRRRLWQVRVLLESYCHDASCFITLTYGPDDEPSGGNLNPRHLQLFWKVLRKRLSGRSIRYFAVGEYGDVKGRPHYHAAVFGMHQVEQDHIEAAWKRGFVQVCELNPATAQYLVGYTVKKLTHSDDFRLEGRHPEFARMSNRPGIGRKAAKVIAESYKANFGGEVPDEIKVRISGREYGIGRYLSQKVRKDAGLSEDEILQIKARLTGARQEEMSAVREIAWLSGETVVAELAALDAGKAASLEARTKIYSQRRL